MSKILQILVHCFFLLSFQYILFYVLYKLFNHKMKWYIGNYFKRCTTKTRAVSQITRELTLSHTQLIISLEASPFICFRQRLSPLKHLPLYASNRYYLPWSISLYMFQTRDYLPWSISLYMLQTEIISLEASPFICFRQRLSLLKHLPLYASDRDYLPWSISLYMLRTEIISLNAHPIGVLLKLCKVSSILVYQLIRRTCGYETYGRTDRVITIYPLHHHLKRLCLLVYLLLIHI